VTGTIFGWLFSECSMHQWGETRHFPQGATRRQFLGNLAAGVGTAAGLGQLAGLPRAGAGQGIGQAGANQAADGGAVAAPPVGKRLLARTASPYNAEPELAHLVRHWITPLESFYVRSHGTVPTVGAEPWELAVEGLVERPGRFAVGSLAERFPLLDTVATLTCAGNRRQEFGPPKISGVPWGAGAIGNARWQGIGLADLLRHCGVKEGAGHVWFEGADRIQDKGASYLFGGSIPLSRVFEGAWSAEPVLLATHMNDQPLTPSHGAPLRSVVPGFIGARSVKWLTKLVVAAEPSPNHYVAHAYKVIADERPETIAAADPIYGWAVNSVICTPAGGAPRPGGMVRAEGFALASGGPGARPAVVELSADGGQSWQPARVVSPVKSGCWVLWVADVRVPAESPGLLVRTSDSAGVSQPREMTWNAKGYQFNGWHGVRWQSR
jgi:sulfite oxidase